MKRFVWPQYLAEPQDIEGIFEERQTANSRTYPLVSPEIIKVFPGFPYDEVEISIVSRELCSLRRGRSDATKTLEERQHHSNRKDTAKYSIPFLHQCSTATMPVKIRYGGPNQNS